MCMLLCVFLVTQISEWKVVVTGELNGLLSHTHTLLQCFHTCCSMYTVCNTAWAVDIIIVCFVYMQC